MIRLARNPGRLAGLCLTLLTAVGLSVPSQPAKAALVIRNVNVTLDAAIPDSFDLDVDLDGTIDFTFTAAFVPDPFLSVGFDVVDFPFASNNGVVIDAPTGDGFPTASLLGLGGTVSGSNDFSSASFDQGNLFFFTSFDPPSGNFGGRTGFVGLRFDGPGGILFGFAEVTVNALDAPANPLDLTIGRVGFNDVPGQAAQIGAVPEPATLMVFGVAALGLLAASRWTSSAGSSARRREMSISMRG